MTVDQNILVRGDISDATLEAFKKWLEEAKRSGDTHIAQNVGYFNAKQYLTEVTQSDGKVSQQDADAFLSGLNSTGNFIYIDADYDNQQLGGLFQDGLLFNNRNDDGVIDYLDAKRRIQILEIKKAQAERDRLAREERARAEAAEKEQARRNTEMIDQLLKDEEVRKRAREKEEERRRKEEKDRRHNEAKEAMEREARNEAEQYRRNEQLERQRTARYYDPDTGEFYVPGEREALLKKFFSNSHLGDPRQSPPSDFKQYLRELMAGQMRIGGVDEPECGTVPIRFNPTGSGSKVGALHTVSFSLVDQPEAQTFEISF